MIVLFLGYHMAVLAAFYIPIETRQTVGYSANSFVSLLIAVNAFHLAYYITRHLKLHALRWRNRLRSSSRVRAVKQRKNLNLISIETERGLMSESPRKSKRVPIESE